MISNWHSASMPRAVPGITVDHEMVGVVESVGSAATTVKPGDRVAVNGETFCGECIPGIENDRLRLVREGKFTVFDLG